MLPDEPETVGTNEVTETAYFESRRSLLGPPAGEARSLRQPEMKKTERCALSRPQTLAHARKISLPLSRGERVASPSAPLRINSAGQVRGLVVTFQGRLCRKSLDPKSFPRKRESSDVDPRFRGGDDRVHYYGWAAGHGGTQNHSANGLSAAGSPRKPHPVVSQNVYVI